MTDNPNDHPAVNNPKNAVLQNTNLVVAKSAKAVKPAVKGAANNNVSKPKKKIGSMNPKEILEFVFPNEMSNVEVKPMRKNKNPLVKSFGYGAWTQNSKLIYYNKFPLFMPYIMRHEGLHIRQRRPSSFIEMMDFESSAYPETEEWVSTTGKTIWTKTKNFKTIRDESIKYSKEMISTTQLFRSIIASGVFLSEFEFNSHPNATNEFYKKDLEDFLKDRINKGLPMSDELFAQVVMIKFNGLPKIKKVNNKYMIYTVDDLYLTGESQEDKDRFKILGY